jgi:hypothetical protein
MCDSIDDKHAQLLTVLSTVVWLQVPYRISTNIVSLLASHYGQVSRNFEQDTLRVIDSVIDRYLLLPTHSVRAINKPVVYCSLLQPIEKE